MNMMPRRVGVCRDRYQSLARNVLGESRHMIAAIMIAFHRPALISVPFAVAIGLAVISGLNFFSPFPAAIMFQKMAAGIDSFVLAAIPCSSPAV